MATGAVESGPDLAELLARVERGEAVALAPGGAVVARIERAAPAAHTLDALGPEEMMEHIRRMRAARRLGEEDIDALIDDLRQALEAL
mgnify:FL=1